MGSQDQLERGLVNGVRQEIVVVAGESTDEFRDELVQWVERCYPELKGRVEARWNTWKGVYVTHPDDYPAWSPEEYNKICQALGSNSLVWRLDYSVDAGSAG